MLTVAAGIARCDCRTATTGLLDPVTAEKQISLLSRGLTHHPSSTQLLLALLRCYAAVAPDADAAEAKWAAVLARQGGSWELWREYIALRWVCKQGWWDKTVLCGRKTV